VGTLNQASGRLAIVGVAKALYAYTYTISGLTGTAPTATISTAFASVATTLTTSANGTYTTYFHAAASPGDFVVNATSAATGAFTIDTLSLRRITGGDAIVNGFVQGAHKSSDGTSGVTVTTCTGFKDGLCIAGR
jgi:hypothetical protein